MTRKGAKYGRQRKRSRNWPISKGALTNWKKEKAEDFIFRYVNGRRVWKLYLGVLSGAIRIVDRGGYQ